uniref:Uncharacterized protein n=1 Tax=Anguilla anguilla TaxID=7936 RepID=A0A0E9U5M1_ANGAN
MQCAQQTWPIFVLGKNLNMSINLMSSLFFLSIKTSVLVILKSLQT